ncbi:MAG TPA: hypothetical protein VNL98_05955, partial [Gemmatimonadales bacterium]|nr:hypothetical protein [Gemmatimonadales bacterium]
RIFESGRNRPGGPPPQPEPGSQEEAMRETIRNVFAGGMPPAEVAQKVVDAIAARRFYILTHDHFKPIVERRAAAIVNGEPPPTAGPPRILRQQP